MAIPISAVETSILFWATMGYYTLPTPTMKVVTMLQPEFVDCPHCGKGVGCGVIRTQTVNKWIVVDGMQVECPLCGLLMGFLRLEPLSDC